MSSRTAEKASDCRLMALMRIAGSFLLRCAAELAWSRRYTGLEYCIMLLAKIRNGFRAESKQPAILQIWVK